MRAEQMIERGGLEMIEEDGDPNGSSPAFEQRFVRPRPGWTLVVGSRIYEGRTDRRAAFPRAIGLDLQAGLGVDVVHDLTEPLEGFRPFAHVDCVSVLEHTPRPWLVAQNIERLLMPGGTIFVAAPFVHRVHAYPGDFFRFTPEGLCSLFSEIDWIECRLGGERLYPARRVSVAKIGGHPYLARSEALCFGRRR